MGCGAADAAGVRAGRNFVGRAQGTASLQQTMQRVERVVVN
jgi:hypothetical protein